jgi:transposase
MDLIEPGFDSSTFSKNRQRLLKHEVAREFFDVVVRRAAERDLLSDQHFSVDGTPPLVQVVGKSPSEWWRER